ncbi:MAG: DNA-binding protein WhiA [Oscillospiraceae bacterium]|nr:DNA-binding protein WhiA [Oscillospiraceae bacterium]
MTFSAQVKKELCAHIIEKPCCARAFCFGAACFSHTFTPEKLEFHTENELAARYLRTMFAAQGITLHAGTYWVHGRDKLSLATDDEQGSVQLKSFAQRCKADLYSSGALSKLLRCASCRGAFLAGAFLCGGIVADPAKEYHLEFVTQNSARLDELAQLLAADGLEPRRIRKNANDVLYLSASEQVEDLLAAMGAGHNAMEIMNAKIYKTYRNQANRITNCETANIDKTLAANEKVLAAIRYLQTHDALEALPEQLRCAALARLQNPEATLAELAALMQPPVSKSGLSHRMKKLVDTADALRRKEQMPETV